MTDQTINSYRDLRAWQDAVTLAGLRCRLARQFLCEELFGVAAPIRRAVGSVLTDIAAGQGREDVGTFAQYPPISEPSLKELQPHLALVQGAGILPVLDLQFIFARCDSLSKMPRTRSLQDKAST